MSVEKIPEHAYFRSMMAEALLEAKGAAERGEVPVGCVITRDGEIIARAGNAPIANSDPSAHAEILALRQAGESLGNYRLVDCDLFVTLEPCLMCVGAMVHARISRVFWGAADPKTGAAGSVFDLLSSPFHNHQVKVVGGISADECGQQLAQFFRARRRQKKKQDVSSRTAN